MNSCGWVDARCSEIPGLGYAAWCSDCLRERLASAIAALDECWRGETYEYCLVCGEDQPSGARKKRHTAECVVPVLLRQEVKVVDH